VLLPGHLAETIEKFDREGDEDFGVGVHDFILVIGPRRAIRSLE
jgi:hypothetical protein